MPNMKQCLFLTYNRYPEGDAGSVRQAVFAKMLRAEGYHVTVVGMGAPTGFEIVPGEPADYISFRHENAGTWGRICNLAGYWLNLKRFLNRFGRIDLLFVVNPPATAFFTARRYAKANGIPMLYDCVEWYSPEEFSMGKLSPSYYINNRYNTKWIDAPCSVVAISSYLEKHFRGRGLRTVRIPAIMDVQAMQSRKTTEENRVVFLYAGSPGKKDSLAQVVEAYTLLPETVRSATQLRLVGIDKSQLSGLCGVEESTFRLLGDRLQCLGRVSRHEVLRQLEQADFTVLLRPAGLRYAMAGFPTKVTESLACATPVILNLTSDLSMYIRDMENGLVVRDDTSASLAQAMERATRLQYGQRLAMQRQARKTAEECLDFRCFQAQLHSLLPKDECYENQCEN